PAVRLMLVVVAVVSLTVPLGALFAIQRSLDTAAFRYGDFATFSEIEVYPTDLKQFRQDFGDNSYLSARWEAPVESNGEQIPVLLRVTTTPHSTAGGWFPRGTRRPGAIELDQGWMDVTSATARRLGISPGDEVTVWASPTTSVTLTLRAVHD